MTTIRESLESKLQESQTARVAHLERLTAPQVQIDGLKAQLVKGNLASRVGKIKDFGHLEFTAVEGKKYRLGQGAEFTLADGSEVWLVPGSYGLFLTNKEGK